MDFKVYGTATNGECPSEQVEMATFFNILRRQCPEYYKIAIHVRNEGKRTQGQVARARYEGGFVKGAADIIIPGAPTFVCEMKSRSKSARLSKEQIEYLTAAHQAGAFACVALGHAAAWEAVQAWIGGQARSFTLS